MEPGVKFNVNEKFAVELGVPLGFGAASYTEKGTGYSLDASGTYGEVGRASCRERV